MSRWTRVGYLGWPLIFFGLLSIVLFQVYASDYDHGVANVATALIGLASWIGATFLLWTSSCPRLLWRSLLLIPIVGGAAFLSVRKFDGFSGGLVPQFRPRWTETSERLNASSIESTERTSDVTLTLKPSAQDSPQFLGPSRNAQWSKPTLDPGWEITPPKIVWKKPIGAGWSSFAVQGDLAITMEQRDNEEWVSAYNKRTGDLVWHYSISAVHSNPLGGTGPRSTPAIYEDLVYACSAVGKFICLQLRDGRAVWSKDLNQLANVSQAQFEASVSWGRSASPLVVDHIVIVPLGGSGNDVRSLIAFDRLTGDEMWRGGSDQISYSSPVLATLDGVNQILLITEKLFSGFDVASGETLWSAPWDGSSSGSASTSQPLIVSDTETLLTKGYSVGSKLLEIKRNESFEWRVREVWQSSRVMKTKLTSAVKRDEFAYGLSDGILEAMRINDGAKQWKRGRYGDGQVLLINEFLLITSEAGDIALVAADASEFKELAKLKVIDGITWNVPTLSGNLLMMRNSREMACVELPTISD